MRLLKNKAGYSLGVLLISGALASGLLMHNNRAIAQSSPVPTPTPSIQPITQNFVAKVRKQGGLCVNAGCFSQVTISFIGKSLLGQYEYTDSSGKKATGRIQPAQMSKLTRLIGNTNFAQIKSRPFQGTCPIAFDGPETIYFFRKAQGVEELPECKFEIDRNAPLFEFTDKLYEQIIAEVFPPQQYQIEDGKIQPQ
jgi:hypothetical protein